MTNKTKVNWIGQSLTFDMLCGETIKITKINMHSEEEEVVNFVVPNDFNVSVYMKKKNVIQSNYGFQK